MKKTLITVPLFFASTAVLSADFDKATARQLFKEMIEHNTVLANGTADLVNTIDRHLRSVGYGDKEIKIGGVDDKHQNIVVRLAGKTNREPVLLIAHLDVVEALASDWSLDPFTFTEKDGYFYGRGTSDIKNEVSNLVFNMIRLKREGYVPQRDIIVALTDAEEVGDQFNGISWLLKTHPDWIKAEYVLNLDGGGGEIKNGVRRALDVQTSEKIYRVFEVTATDKGGHSSLPTKANAIHRLAHGLHKLDAFEFPIRLNETTRAYFKQMAQFSDGADRDAMLALSKNEQDKSALAQLTQSTYYNALLRTTCVPTLINGGHSENALPQKAVATVQCRLLPDDSTENVKATLEKILDDAGLVVTQVGNNRPSPASPLRDDVMNALRDTAKKHFPGAVLLPVMTTGASDGTYLRAAGIPVYGVSATFEDVDDGRAHGRDERILMQSYYDAIAYTYDLMKRVTSR